MLSGVLDSGAGKQGGTSWASQSSAGLCWQREAPPQKLATRSLPVAGNGGSLQGQVITGFVSLTREEADFLEEVS